MESIDSHLDASIKVKGRMIVRRYTDELAGDNDLEKAVQRHPIEPLEPRVDQRQRSGRQLWQESDESARWGGGSANVQYSI